MNESSPHLDFYEKPPSGYERYENLQEYIVKRLELYQILLKTQSDTKENLHNLIENKTLFSNLLKSTEIQRIDAVSHWMLRLVYSENDQCRKLFVKLEKFWFQYRLTQLTVDEITNISQKLFKLSPAIVTDDIRLSDNNCNLEYVQYFCVKFTQVPDLVTKRIYFLKNGYIYIPDYELSSLLTNYFIKNLEKSSLHVAKVLPTIQSDQFDLLLSTIQIIKDDYVDIGESSFKDLVNLENIDEFSQQFPMCMRYLHENLRNTHHLKYFSRMQYGLFVKGLGFNLDATLHLFRNEFIKTMPAIRFTNKYAYLFRHNYGLVGSKINRKPYSCETIFEIAVNPQQTHGCPFKHWSNGRLYEKLQDYGLDNCQINTIIDLKQKELYNMACGRYFEFVNETELIEEIVHPNQYFFNCCKIREGDTDTSDVDIEDLV